MKIFKKIKKNQSGVSLLITLIILSSVLAAIIGLSVLIINELRLSRNVNHSIMAYYAAETGIEKGLYSITQHRIMADSLSDTVSDLADNNDSLGNNAYWDTGGGDGNGEATKAAFDMFSSVLPQDQSVQYSLFDPDDLDSEPGTPNGVDSVAISWDYPDNADNDTIIETTVIELSNVTGEICEKVKKDWWQGLVVPSGLYRLDTDIIPDPLCYGPAEDIFQIRVKAINEKIYNLRLVAYDDESPTPNKLEIESGISLKSVGQFHKSQQAILIEVPWQLSATGFLDYVIFSQEELTKI